MAAERFPDDFELSLIDVGAAGGIHPRWGKMENPKTSVLMIEPEARAFDELGDSAEGRIKVSAVALSAGKGTRFLHVARKGMCSSFHKRNFEFVNRFPLKERFDIIGEEETPTESLDDTVSGSGFDIIDFIKLDVEGHENAVISQGQETFGKAIGIEAELVFAPLFVGGAKFCDQHNSFTALGYELYDLQRYYWRRENGRDLPSRGQIIFCNGLYLKTPETVIAEDATDARRVRAALRIYASFGLLDLVKEMHDLSLDRGLLNERESQMVSNHLNARRYAKGHDAPSGIVHRVLMKVSRLFAGLARKIEPTRDERSFYGSDEELGQ